MPTKHRLKVRCRLAWVCSLNGRASGPARTRQPNPKEAHEFQVTVKVCNDGREQENSVGKALDTGSGRGGSVSARASPFSHPARASRWSTSRPPPPLQAPKRRARGLETSLLVVLVTNGGTGAAESALALPSRPRRGAPCRPAVARPTTDPRAPHLASPLPSPPAPACGAEKPRGELSATVPPRRRAPKPRGAPASTSLPRCRT